MPLPAPIPTPRLILRPFTSADAPDIARLAADFPIADMTLSIPHPYTLADADAWLTKLPESYAAGTNLPLAITLATTRELVGTIGLEVAKPHHRAELGYWIGTPYWNRGYATEAATAMLAFGFTPLNLTRITAHHFARNPASGRVLQKIGMTCEGTLRQHIRKWERYEDCVIYAILRSEHAGT